MEFTDNPLEPAISDRGLAYMPPIRTAEGATIEVHDSSNAEHDELWLEFAPILEQSTLDGKYSIAARMGDALTFARQIIALAERRGYRTDDPANMLDTAHVDRLVDHLNTAADRLTEALPAQPEGELRSESGRILELGAYLATVHTAAALAEDIPKLIADLDITAFTTDIGAHLTSAARKAEQRIHELARTPEDDQADPKVFPPYPYHVNSAADYLASLRTNALALAARAEAVRAELECYLDTYPEPDHDSRPTDTTESE